MEMCLFVHIMRTIILYWTHQISYKIYISMACHQQCLCARARTRTCNQRDCRDYFAVASFGWFPMGNIVSSRFFFSVRFCFHSSFSPLAFCYYICTATTTLFHFNDRCMRDMGIDYLFIGNFVCMLLISLIFSIALSIKLFHIIVIVGLIFFSLLFCH